MKFADDIIISILNPGPSLVELLANSIAIDRLCFYQVATLKTIIPCIGKLSLSLLYYNKWLLANLMYALGVLSKSSSELFYELLEVFNAEKNGRVLNTNCMGATLMVDFCAFVGFPIMLVESCEIHMYTGLEPM